MKAADGQRKSKTEGWVRLEKRWVRLEERWGSLEERWGKLEKRWDRLERRTGVQNEDRKRERKQSLEMKGVNGAWRHDISQSCRHDGET